MHVDCFGSGYVFEFVRVSRSPCIHVQKQRDRPRRLVSVRHADSSLRLLVFHRMGHGGHDSLYRDRPFQRE